jgi:hypothetical protein
MPIGAVAGLAGAAGSVGGGIMGKSAASKAAKQQSGAAQKATDIQTGATHAANATLTNAYQSAAGQLQPYQTAGGNALNQLQWGLGQDSTTYDPNAQTGPRKSAADYRNELIDSFMIRAPRNKYGDIKMGQADKVDEAGLSAAIAQRVAADDAAAAATAANPYQGTGEKGGLLRNFQQSDFQEDPGYQFAVDQGQRGIQNSAAASGNLLSGATLKALTRFNQDTANNQYQNSYNRFNQNQQSQLNSLFNLSGVGQNAAGQVAGYGMNTGSQIAGNILGLGQSSAQNTQQAGNAQSAGTIAGANALTQGIGGAINQLSSTAAMNSSGGMNSLGGMGRQSSYIQQPYQPMYGSPFGAQPFNGKQYSY